VAALAFALSPRFVSTASRSATQASSCLDCHGPFDKLSASTAGWKAPSGEKTSPHRYVPHDSKQPDDVPDCKNCHAAHPQTPPPASGSIDLSKVTVEWCYKTCHHEKTFEPCKKCHKTDDRLSSRSGQLAADHGRRGR
jgi:hypothetical protein